MPLSAVPRFQGPEGQEDMPYLLTPGPLTTSRGVKLSMLADYGSRDVEFRDIVKAIRAGLLKAALCDASYECVIMQGSGTFAIEAALGCFCPKEKKTLVVANGAYGDRAAAILARIGRPVVKIDKGDSAAPTVDDVTAALDADPDVTHVWMIHCETTSGIVNPIAEIAAAVKARGLVFMVDAMSSFGALALDMTATQMDVMVSSSNKCIEGVPGFSYVLVKRALLEAAKGQCHSVVLDLFEQWKGLEANGQFRFTPPTHALVAFHTALREFEAEGGVAARAARYRRNAQMLVKGMRDMGFATLLSDNEAGPIIQTFLTPRDPNFDFETFYEALRVRGFAIYPGKLTRRPSFRIGTIGKVDGKVMAAVLAAIREVMTAMNVSDFSPLEG